MARFRWQALTPDTPWVVGTNPDGTPKLHTFTRADSRKFAASGNAMLQAGINIPVSMEHRDDQKPRQLSRDDWASERAKGTAGWVDKFLVSKNTGIMFVEGEAPSAEDAKAIEANRFCSPEIDAFKDGKGLDWGEVITHLAVTPRPVQHDQTPVLRLSQTCMRLSLDPKDGKDLAKSPEVPPDPAPEPKPEPEPSPAPTRLAAPPPPKAPPPEQPAPAAEAKPAGDKPEEKVPDKAIPENGNDGTGNLTRLIEALREAGLTIPDEVQDVAGLIIAVKASGGASALQPLDDLEEVPPTGQTGAATGGAAMPLMMSLEGQKRLSALETKIVADERVNLSRDLNWLFNTGRITRQDHAAQSKLARAVRMSLNAAGEPDGDEYRPVREWIAARKTLKAWSVMPRTAKDNTADTTRLSVTDPPPEMLGDNAQMTPERRAELKAHAREVVHGKQRPKTESAKT